MLKAKSSEGFSWGDEGLASIYILGLRNVKLKAGAKEERAVKALATVASFTETLFRVAFRLGKTSGIKN